MKKILIYAVLSLVLAGCKTTRKVVETVNTNAVQQQTAVSKDSVIVIRDTTYITQYIKSEEQEITTMEAALQEFWDDWTRYYTDSIGNPVVEVHSTGNRSYTQKDQSSRINMLLDSLSSYQSDYWSLANRYDSLASNFQMQQEREYKSETKTTDRVFSPVLAFIIGLVVGAVLLVLIFVKYKK